MGADTADIEDLLEAMKRATNVLTSAGIPYALAGGLAVYARGGPYREHDVDLVIRERDVRLALDALEAAGMRSERPPLNWLVKAYDGDVLIDLIHRPVDRPVTDETLAKTDVLPLSAHKVPVLSATELLVHTLLTLSTHECDMTSMLALMRALREQIDFDRVRAETAESPYARACLYLAEQLNLVPRADTGGTARTHADGAVGPGGHGAVEPSGTRPGVNEVAANLAAAERAGVGDRPGAAGNPGGQG